MGVSNLLMPAEIPFSDRAEKGLIGCCILGAYSDAVAAGISERHFYGLNALEAWRIMADLVEAGAEINEVNVTAKAPKLGMWLYEAIEKAPTASNLGFWLPELQDTATRRMIYQRYYDALHAVSDPDTDTKALLAKLESDFFEITANHSGKASDQKKRWRDFVELLETAYPNGLPSTGIRTGMDAVDDILRGFKPGSMNTLAARPGCGKTALACQLALNAAMQGKQVVYWSYEMPFEQVISRMVANHSGEDLGHYMETGQGDTAKIIQSTKAIAQSKIIVEDQVDTNITQLRSQARTHARERNAELFVVDYLGLIPPAYRGKDRVREVGEISQALKKSALETKVPFLVLCQMNRSIEERSGEPRLSDLRESGSIEQDSDTVSFLHMDPNEDQLTQLLVRKNRHGRTGKVGLNWTKWNGRFSAYNEPKTDTI